MKPAWKERYEQAYAAGLCVQCKKPRDSDRKWCLECRLQDRQRQERLIQQGICRCRSPLPPGRRTCQGCTDKDRDRKRRRREEGNCPQCGNGLDNPAFLQCSRCRSTKLKRPISEINHCKNPPSPRAGRLYFLPRPLRRALQQLWEEQQGCCAYTGLPLTPGHSSSIDHRIPRHLGGTDELENLQWILRQVNSLKGARSHDLFVKLCHLATDEPWTLTERIVFPGSKNLEQTAELCRLIAKKHPKK